MKTSNSNNLSTSQMYTRLKRGDLNYDALKKSAIVASLRKRGDSPQEISQQSGICIAHVYNYLKMNTMPEKIKKYIKEGRIGPTDVLKYKRVYSNEKAFINAIEEHIHNKESKKIPHGDLDILLREQKNNPHGIDPQTHNQFMNEIARVIRKFLPVKVPKSKIEIAANLVNSVIAM